MNIQEESSILL